jgi:hypothetical protein
VPPEPPREFSAIHRLKRQLPPRELLPKTFFVSSRVKYVAVIRRTSSVPDESNLCPSCRKQPPAKSRSMSFATSPRFRSSDRPNECSYLNDSPSSGRVRRSACRRGTQSRLQKSLKKLLADAQVRIHCSQIGNNHERISSFNNGGFPRCESSVER